ncbi:enhancer of split malpha protein-like [Coccinella septempunctata]|uniref:enhancer of split malpha protein-like n=1 Tax=Coccinella septempunctata TaxID=41139 RepID=UPI001D090213|nr:enhancer of split malpha protein-like [Coccinella septempunctata]
MSNFDYIMSSNNSVNENKYNAKKSKSAVHQIKSVIRPIVNLIKKKKNTYRSSPQPDYFRDNDEVEDNQANEKLEREIFGEIDACHEFAAIPIYEDGRMQIEPVYRGQRYIPVHFAKTEAGTFFWTTMVGPDYDIDNNGDKNAITYNQHAEIQAADRWAQA